jgi:peptide/nickel transport system substrate-binding protein
MSPSHSRPAAAKSSTFARKVVVPIVALGLAFSVAACQQVQTVEDAPQGDDVVSAPIGDQTVVEGGDLVMALSAEPDRLDPTTSTSLYTRYVMQTMCEKLYDIDQNGDIVPMLAEELPEVSDDGLTVTIPVRSGISSPTAPI